MYNLAFKQGVQVLVKESKLVRKSVINYIKQLESRVKQLKRRNGKIIRRLETDTKKVYWDMEKSQIKNTINIIPITEETEK